ncbi:transposase [Ammoniphilus sp. YIM 78166]|uniref:transposase n=1 Tax=Ammoniphilus sp. YIM 78166 TaxID=1644106 RepID=UPI00106F9557|nr:transposase [Ammoniphilus sp. YIM 78166]
MNVMIILGNLVIPLIMFLAQKNKSKARLIFNGLSVLSAIVFGNLAALAVYRIIRDNTVFMTHIHGIFLNPFFLLAGYYLLVYTLYQLIRRMSEDV